MNIKQKLILRKLVESNGRRYSELFKYFDYEDKFPYHLKQLLKYKLITKHNNLYYLTKSGMYETALFDRDSLENIKFPIPLIVGICTYKGKYFINSHFDNLKNSENLFYSLPSVKPLYGLPLKESCKLEFKRKYQLEGQFDYLSTMHLLNFTTDMDVLFDNIYLIFKCCVSDHSYKTSSFRDKFLSIECISNLENKSIVIDKYLLSKAKTFVESEYTFNYGMKNYLF